jgi:hypothetical protein
MPGPVYHDWPRLARLRDDHSADERVVQYGGDDQAILRDKFDAGADGTVNFRSSLHFMVVSVFTPPRALAWNAVNRGVMPPRGPILTFLPL